MKIICIYHSVDLDGWMSAAIVKHALDNGTVEVIDVFTSDSDKLNSQPTSASFYNNKLSFFGYNYGDTIPDLSDYDKIIMCDVSFPKKEMLKLVDKLIWIDHHIFAIDDMQVEMFNNAKSSDSLKCRLDTNYAACELTWQYFFHNEPMPEIVRLLGRYDCFRHKGTYEEQKVLEFQYACRNKITNYKDAYIYLTDMLSRNKGINKTDFKMVQIQKEGYVIYKYLCTEAKQIYKNGFEIHFSEEVNTSAEIYMKTGLSSMYEFRRFICINKERFNPINFGIDYHKDGYDGAACFHYTSDTWNFSLYSDSKKVNCSTIAKQYGGKGYKDTASFKINNIGYFLKNVSYFKFK